MIIRKIFLLIGLIVLFSGGCNDDDLDQLNPNNLTPENFFKTIDELRQGVTAAYGVAQAHRLVGRYYFFLHDMRSDENASGGGQLGTQFNQILLGVHDAGNPLISEVWNGFYTMIHRTNTVLSNGAEATDLPADELNKVLGEARFLRGWAYFELASMWGGVPLYLEPAATPGSTLPRSSREEVYAQVKTDLEFAAANLPTEWDDANLGRATKGAALAMLGRFSLQKGDWAAAENYFNQVKGLGIYALTEDYYDNFKSETEFNSESIFEIGFSKIGDFNWNGDGDGPTNEVTVRAQEYSPVGWRNVIPSQKFLESHERESAGDPKTDPRLHMNAIFTEDTYANGTAMMTADAQRGNTTLFEGEEQKISWFKWGVMYKLDPGGYYTSGINQRIIRYGEVLLGLAEIENEKNDNQQAAVDIVNQIRARVDMPPLPTSRFPVGTKEEVRQAIQHERFIEFGSELIRNRDILRWREQGLLAEEPFDYFVANKHELLPIPQSEINNNDKLTEADQNPGY